MVSPKVKRVPEGGQLRPNDKLEFEEFLAIKVINQALSDIVYSKNKETRQRAINWLYSRGLTFEDCSQILCSDPDWLRKICEAAIVQLKERKERRAKTRRKHCI